MTTPIQVPPYPYRFITKSTPIELNHPHILITGDHLGKSLTNYQEALSQELSKDLESPLLIQNISENGEGLHRTLHKLKLITKLPKVVIFYGGSEEFFEETFNKNYLGAILQNLKRYQDDRVKTTLEILPELSKFIFNFIPPQILQNDIVERKAPIPDEKIMPTYEMSYILYEIELEELIKTIKSQNSNLIIITPPLNLEVLPKKVCNESSSEKIMLVQDYVFGLLQEDKFEEAVKELLPLEKLMPANALTHYLLGKAYLSLGNQSLAVSQLELAATYDCGAWRSSPIFLAIQRKLAAKYDVMLIDYHSLMSEMLGKNILFLDDIFPQHLFNERMIHTLIIPIKKYLKL